MKPRVFIGSSTEGLDVARAIELNLDQDCECVLWKSNVFEISATFIESLEKALSEVEFAVLVVTPDDLRVKRDETSKIPRDNIVFELGLFMGRLGRQRAFVVCDPKYVQLPTDLTGLSLAEYDSKRSDGDPVKAVSVAASKIILAIRKAPRLAPSEPTSSNNLLLDQDALFNAIVSWPTTDSEIIIQTLSTDWVWKIFPTLMHWRLNNVQVHVFAPPMWHEGTRREAAAQRALLRELGVDFRETKDISVSAFFLRTHYPEDDIVVVLNEGIEKEIPLAVRYAGRAHAGAIEALNKVLSELPMPPTTSLYAPSLVPQEIAEITNRLRTGVSQYRSPKVEMDLTTIRTSELLLMSPYARSYKYKQLDNLVDSYRAIEQPPFTALAVTLKSGGRSIVTPPVVEERPEGPVVIEGTTRATYCYRNNIDEYHCILVRGVRQDLPGKPVEIKNVTIAERSLSQRQRTEDFDYTLFRSIERAIHPY